MRLLIVSHGQPSAPAQAEAELASLAQEVAVHLPDWQVGSATLAAPGALAAAVAGDPGRVYPLFMAGGWFTRSFLPRRLAEAGGQAWQVLEPMGCDPAVGDLAVQIVREALPATSLILAAHGSGQSPVPAAIAKSLAARIARETGLSDVTAAFIDQAPRLSGIGPRGADALCLPFFAADGGHVTADIPAALKSAGFQGRLLPALGLDPRLPALIAAAARTGAPICPEACRAGQTV